MDESFSEVAAADAAVPPPIDPATGTAFENPPVIPDQPEVDGSDGITLDDATTDIPGDIPFTDTGTTGQAQAPDTGEQEDDTGAGAGLASVTLLAIVPPAILLGALGW